MERNLHDEGKEGVFDAYFCFFLELKQIWQACKIFVIEEDDLEDADVATYRTVVDK
jgi:hypothetical protein